MQHADQCCCTTVLYNGVVQRYLSWQRCIVMYSGNVLRCCTMLALLAATQQVVQWWCGHGRRGYSTPEEKKEASQSKRIRTIGLHQFTELLKWGILMGVRYIH